MEFSNSQKTGFNVVLDVYEGPFDLLLAIIQKSQLDICEIPIAKIANNFLTYLEENGKKLDDMSSFLPVAAILMNIKADTLLPKVKQDDEYELDLDELDPSIELAASLIQYKKFKNVALELQAKFETEEKYYEGRVTPESIKRANINCLQNIDVFDLANAYAKAFLRTNQEVDTGHIVGSIVSIEERIEHILRHLSANDPSKHNFSSLVKDCKSKIEKIVTFLALLELYKAGAISLAQKVNFGEIDIVPVKISL